MASQVAVARSNVIQGTVCLAGSRIGIPGLVVVALDADASAPRAGAAAPARARLGSATTADDGTFRVTFDDGDLDEIDGRPGQRKRPDVIVLVQAPEGSAMTAPLFATASPRARAGRAESFVIELAAEALAKAGVAVPTGNAAIERPTAVAERMRTAIANETALREARRAIHVERVTAVRREHATVEAAVDLLGAALSTVSRAMRESPTFVGPGRTVGEVSVRALEIGAEALTHHRHRIHAVLTPAQVAELEAEFPDLANIPFERARRYLVGNSSTPQNLLGDDPASLALRAEAHADDPCLAILRGTETPAPPAPAPGSNGAPGAPPVTPPLDPSAVVAKLLARMTVPEEGIVFDVPTRPGQGDVDAQIQGLALKSGPADTPAFHDFHALQIAFPYVWQEVFDDDLLATASDLYEQIVELGGDLTAMASSPVGSSTHQDALHSLRREVRIVSKATTTSSALSSADAGVQPQAMARPFGLDVNVPALPPGGALVYDGTRKPPQTLLSDLEARLAEPYAFTVYGASRTERSVNFGIVATYRQKWEPLAYQVGELSRTVTLAPKESRKYTTKTSRRQKRSEKEVKTYQRSRRDESTDTQRAEAEILRKAQAKTNFSLATEGTYNVLFAKGDATTSLGKEAASQSDEVKKELRESVVRAAEEYKLEQTTEVVLDTERTEETEESGELTNPNDEIPVTYLFYELQRRYRVSERVHRVTPVVLVAQEVPKPNEITQGWLVAHDWILKRALLDDSFRPALDYLAEGLAGDEKAVEVLLANLNHQKQVTEKITGELESMRREAGRRYAMLEASLEDIADMSAENQTEGLGEKAKEWLRGSGDDESAEAARVRENAAREAYERAERLEKELVARLEREVTALQVATEGYTRAVREQLNKRVQVARLRLHVKQNILHYMQAIWSYEPPDQRFFRLHKVQVPRLTGTVTLTAAGTGGIPRPPNWDVPPLAFDVSIVPDPLEYTELVEVADLDELLGFKGNYMVFRLKEANALTDTMMIPFLDADFGVRDPDELGNWTLADFSRYVCSLRRKVQTGEISQAQLDAWIPGMRELYRLLLTDPRRAVDEIAIPSRSLYIEALPGSHSLLETFKQVHRAVDVKKVQGEVRALEIENVRAAARILGELLEDKDIEKKIVVEGGRSIVVPADDL